MRSKRIKRRIMGTESEMRIYAVREDTGKPLLVYRLPGGVHRIVEMMRASENDYGCGDRAILSNQVQFYKDSSGPLECVTPECVGARQVVLYETIGMELMIDGIRRYEERCAIEGTPLKIRVYKTNRGGTYDRNGLSKESCGFHGNYLTGRQVSYLQLKESLVPFLATRWCLIGNGWLSMDANRSLSFIFSQRGETAEDLAHESSGVTTQVAKPFIQTRDEPHADKTKWQRLHDISGNHAMSEIQNYIKHGVFDIVLAMIEEDFLAPVPKLDDPLCPNFTSFSRRCNADIFFRHPAKLDNGESWTALDFQRFYLSEAKRYFKENPNARTEERDDVMTLWENTIDALARHDFEYLARYLDWAAIVIYLLKPLCRREHLDFDLFLEPCPFTGVLPETLIFTKFGTRALIDCALQYLIEYANVGSAVSLYGILRARGLMDGLFLEGELLKSRTDPPRTRAAFRKEVLNWVHETDKKEPSRFIMAIDWWFINVREITYADGPPIFKQISIIQNNPYLFRAKRCEFETALARAEKIPYHPEHECNETCDCNPIPV